MSKPIDKRKRQIEEQIFYNLMQIVQTFPQYTLTQHMVHVLRRKGDAQEAYEWDIEKLLKKFENYLDELNSELSSQVVPEELM